jgi:2-polyprenyl-3-methyl-5-hydroxy-6-metoxy-1,4-benzoquinol methylase
MLRTGTVASLEDLEKMTQLNAGRPLMADRAAELGEFLGVSEAEATSIYEMYNVSRTARYPGFDPSTFTTILESYTNRGTFLHDASRLMLHYTRLPMAFQLVSRFNDIFPDRNERISVFDYGCGAADFALAFALHGYFVTLIDLEAGNLRLAKWRFQRRGLEHDVIGISEMQEYPEFKDADIVVAGDLLEHLRDPRAGIAAVHRGLKPNGYFWFPDFPFKEKSVGGAHLESAAALRDESAELVRTLFEGRLYKMKHLMRRK